MKNIILTIIGHAIILTACGNSSSGKNNAADGEVKPTVSVVDTSIKPTTGTIPKMTTSVSDIVTGYLKMKNAFVRDNSSAAATAGSEMVNLFASFNASAITPNQVKIYNDLQVDAIEHAKYISSNAGNIKNQREHFDMLSKDIYQVAKTFGGGQKLYYDHCPMYNDGKGANWLSETKEIANPYLGKLMPTCGTVKEELK